MKWLALLLAPALAATPPDGKAIFLHGNATGALPCAACHGLDARGKSAIGAPPLAGLPQGVIIAALRHFAAAGGNAEMQSIAQALSPAETQAVARYLASLPK